jgi:prepilin-type N-terminal cleavage/methylation domain-containing protein/prepilin-type processing-associated H-X9-DG protein
MNTPPNMAHRSSPLTERPFLRGAGFTTGFTLIELLVTIAIIGVLASFLLPTLSSSKSKIASVKCLNNLKQLQACWQMYVDDFSDSVPPNRSELVDGIWRSSPDSWIGRSSALFDADTKPIEQGLLYKYDYNRVLRNYRCPGDRSKVLTRKGASTSVMRTRSYSMSNALGGNYETNSEPVTIQRAGQVQHPSRLFVFIDEHEDSIDDAHFSTWPKPDDRWVNMPAERHGRVGSLSFADGHAELWPWLASKSFSKKDNYWKRAVNQLDLADLRRLQEAILPAAPDRIPQK